MTRVEILNFANQSELGFKGSILWNTPLLDWQIKNSDNTKDLVSKTFLTTWVSQITHNHVDATIVISYPFEWKEAKESIKKSLPENSKLQFWVHRPYDLPATVPDDTAGFQIEWVLVPSKYDPFQGFFEAAFNSVIKEWSVVFIPSLDRRDAWLSPEDVLHCDLLLKQNPEWKVVKRFTLQECLSLLSGELRELYIEPSEWALTRYWKNQKIKKYWFLLTLKKVSVGPVWFMLNLLRGSLLFFIQPSLVKWKVIQPIHSSVVRPVRWRILNFLRFDIPRFLGLLKVVAVKMAWTLWNIPRWKIYEPLSWSVPHLSKVFINRLQWQVVERIKVGFITVFNFIRWKMVESFRIYVVLRLRWKVISLFSRAWILLRHRTYPLIEPIVMKPFWFFEFQYQKRIKPYLKREE